MGMIEDVLTRGWAKFPCERSVLEWLEVAGAAAVAASEDAELRRDWLRCDGTWFVGVDALANDPEGRVAGSNALRSSALQAAYGLSDHAVAGLHPGQVSVTYPGYPRQGGEESDAAFRFRRDRDATHLDGLRPIGPERRRMMREYHAFILGFPASYAAPGAAPLVVWEGSAAMVARALRAALAPHPVDQWETVDLTEVYGNVRRAVFQTCERIEVPALPGEAVLLHRHTLHGIAPWEDGAIVDADGRAVIYFRPEFKSGFVDWLEAP